jgi:hypothetical protein
MKAHAGGDGQTFLLDSYNIFFRGWKQEDKGKDTHCSSLNVIAHIWGAVCMRLILRQLNLHPLHHPAAAAAHHQNDELDVYTIEKKASSYIALSVLCIRGETRRTTQRPSLDVMNEPCHSPARAECIIQLYTKQLTV